LIVVKVVFKTMLLANLKAVLGFTWSLSKKKTHWAAAAS